VERNLLDHIAKLRNRKVHIVFHQPIGNDADLCRGDVFHDILHILDLRNVFLFKNFLQCFFNDRFNFIDEIWITVRTKQHPQEFTVAILTVVVFPQPDGPRRP